MIRKKGMSVTSAANVNTSEVFWRDAKLIVGALTPFVLLMWFVITLTLKSALSELRLELTERYTTIPSLTEKLGVRDQRLIALEADVKRLREDVNRIDLGSPVRKNPLAGVLSGTEGIR